MHLASMVMLDKYVSEKLKPARAEKTVNYDISFPL